MANEKPFDLIDRAKVYESACVGCTRHGELPGECYHDEPCEKLIFAFTVAEPVDAVEVVHGRWEDGDCTACGFDIRDLIDGESDFRNWVWDGLPYCPNCGAKMDGDVND